MVVCVIVLSRSNYLGGQRYAATWTGDNESNWSHLHMSISMILNLGLSAQPFAGPDIGGFCENAGPKLFSRWMGFGALLPFARAHTHEETDDHEPWSFGPETEELCRVAISRRYMLLPFIYTLFYIAHKTGLPVARPLFFLDTIDPKLRDEDRAFLLGNEVLIIADIYEDESLSSEVKIPNNVKWYDLLLDDCKSRDLPQMKIKAGSIIPIQSVIHHVDEIPSYLGLIIALDDDKKAQGILYEDAGDGFDYQKGEYLLTKYTAKIEGDHISITTTAQGNSPRSQLPLKIWVITPNGNTITHTTINTANTILFSLQKTEK